MKIYKDTGDDPANFSALNSARQTQLVEWIQNKFEPSDRVMKGKHLLYRGTIPFTSSTLKHIFEEETGIYVNNGAFKGAMLVAGIPPVDETKDVWTFKMRVKEVK